MSNKKRRRLPVAAVLMCMLTLAGFSSSAAFIQANGQTEEGSAIEGEIASNRENPVCFFAETWEKAKEIAEEKERQAILAAQREAALREEERKRAEAEAAEQARLQQYDRELLASIIFCEAGNQPYEGQVAVGAVVMNRIRSSAYPDTMEDVIYQAGQFGPVSSGWLDRVRSAGGYTESTMKAAQDAIAGANPVGECLYFDQGGCGIQIGDHFFH